MQKGFRSWLSAGSLKWGDCLKRYLDILADDRQALIEQNLSVVHWVIVESIHVNEHSFGLGYDDLFQEGCIHLCHAAYTYNASLAKFSTYAKQVVRNGLISYCRSLCNEQRHYSYLEVGNRGELISDGDVLESTDYFRDQISHLETLAMLESIKQEYQGITYRGIEALELKIQGYRIVDIANAYNVPASHVGAWISRAKKNLRNNRAFMADLQ